MCTVTYVPTENNYIFTTNRDEHISRADSNFPIKRSINGEMVYFPQDPVANGTWIASSKTKLICVLNGGFIKHKHQPPYRRSRGLIVLDRFEYNGFKDFVESVDLDNIEPFTMIAIDFNSDKHQLYELVWDGDVKHFRLFDNNNKYIWSSSPLYPDDVKAIRQVLFQQADLNSKDAILQFHKSKPSTLARPYQFIMKRDNGLLTMSTTQISWETTDKIMHHISYVNQQDEIIKV